MHDTTFFQDCPICGRGLVIAVEFVGQQVACGHCRGGFQARGSSCESSHQPTVLERAEALLTRGMSRRSTEGREHFLFPRSNMQCQRDTFAKA